ncbi:helix-turn-helix domain-containing protein [Nissabacter sp. SGAir0207]|uniref:helix-turn-helix domain-containing protein n=1 Tax=Nissabacter sp. SGAir0207 TaxID=2126321 RepID=UPI0010CD0EC6|nr:helix-turn-helix transcriptional regulator [Nissabacter sp. SGAir0207]QCR38976.1 XRE family transcriptional regulator [Nissabacter sp. SGAir0207]
MKGKKLEEVKAELMQREGFRAAYEAEERKERLQALLAKWRGQAGLTSAQVAERMGIAANTISRMEKNIETAKIDTLARYARACGVKEATLYF